MDISNIMAEKVQYNGIVYTLTTIEYDNYCEVGVTFRKDEQIHRLKFREDNMFEGYRKHKTIKEMISNGKIDRVAIMSIKGEK